jgi:hypothetical protein
MNLFLNNCRRRDHARLFGKTAFYDLNTFGLQASMATDVVPGQKCIVASYNDDGDIQFDWYAFDKETLDANPDQKNTKVRVFHGKKLETETMSKKKAAGSRKYGQFFNVKGGFKRPSVIK